MVEAAQRSREQKKLAPKPVHIYTNDNIPTSGAVSVVGPSRAPAPGTLAAPAPSHDGEGNERASRSQTEAEWRGRFTALQTKLWQPRTDLALLQRELGDLPVQYYPDPQMVQAQGYTRSDIIKKQADIDTKQEEVADLQQQESEFENEMRKSGGDPGWARKPLGNVSALQLAPDVQGHYSEVPHLEAHLLKSRTRHHPRQFPGGRKARHRRRQIGIGRSA